MTTYREVWQNQQFRVVFGSRTLAIAADTLRIVALSVLVYAATGSAGLAAVAYGISFLPQLLGAGLFGALADRVPARRLISLGYLLEAAVAIVLATVALPIVFALVLVAAVATVTPVFGGASSRVVAEALDGDAYVLGRSMSNMASSAAQLAGLAGAGVAVAVLGDRRAILVSAAGHLLAAAWVRFGLPLRAVAAQAGGTVAASWRGAVGLLRDPVVRRLMLLQWLPPALITGAEALLVPFAGARFAAPEVGGWLLAAAPAGMLAGNLVVGRFVPPAWQPRLVPWLIALMGLPCLAFLTGASWPWLALALLVVGVGFAFGLGLQARFRAAVPPDRLGQAFGLLSTGMMTAQGLLPAIAGVLATLLPVTVVIAGLGSLTVAVAVLLGWGNATVTSPAALRSGRPAARRRALRAGSAAGDAPDGVFRQDGRGNGP